jgi:hypothetical protein
MASETTPTSITESILAEMVMAEVEPAIRERSIVFPLCKYIDASASTSLVVNVLRVDGEAIASISEGTALLNSEFTLSEGSITMGAAGVLVEVMDLAAKSSVANVAQVVTQDLIGACMEGMETAACALLGGFSHHVTDSGADITISDLVTALSYLRIYAKGNASSGCFILYPQQIADLQTEMLSTSTGLSSALTRERIIALFGDSANSSLMAAQVGSFGDLPVFSSTLVPSANSAANSAGALIVPGKALGLAVKWMPEIETQRGISNGQKSTVYHASVAYGVAELVDAYGVSIITDR